MRPAALLLLAAMTLPSCADGGNSVEAFCEAAQSFDTSGDVDIDDLRALAATAPDEIDDDFERTVGVLDELAGLGDTDADYIRAVELTADASFIAASDRVEAYVGDRCGVDLSGESPDPPQRDREPLEVFGIPTRAIERYLDGEASFSARKVGADLFGGGGDAVQGVSVDLRAGTPEDALAACRELSAWLAGHEEAAGTTSVTVSSVRFDDDGLAEGARLVAANQQVRPGDPGECKGRL